MGAWVISFGGLAVLYAGGLCALLWGLTRLGGRRLRASTLLFLFVMLSFVFLTHHPFPDPNTLTCPVRTAVPNLIPFQALPAIKALIVQDAPLLAWLKSRIVAATAMNFLLCFVIGLCLPRGLRSAKSAALFGAALTCGIELSQLSGVFGLYPCAYRQFNVDDLMMNFAGVFMGALVLRGLQKGLAGQKTATF